MVVPIRLANSTCAGRLTAIGTAETVALGGRSEAETPIWVGSDNGWTAYLMPWFSRPAKARAKRLSVNGNVDRSSGTTERVRRVQRVGGRLRRRDDRARSTNCADVGRNDQVRRARWTGHAPAEHDLCARRDGLRA